MDGTLNLPHPLVLATQAADTEVFHYTAAMQQPDRDKFTLAMIKEVEDLTKAEVWELQWCLDICNAKVIKAIWSFKRKRLPDGTYLKHKAQLCAHGGMQIKGEHYWDTYSPVVQWMTVHFLLIVASILNLHMCSINFTLAYTQAPIDIDIYLDLPVGFTVEGNHKDYVLKLKKNLYSLKQAGLSWFETLCNHLISLGFKQSNSNPCVFHHGGLILVCYVDDCLIFSKSLADVNRLIANLQQTFVLTDEGDVSAYLSIQIVKIKDDNGKDTLTMHQPHFTQRILQTMKLMDQRTHDTPAEPRKLLTKDIDGEQCRYEWSYRSVISMCNYLCMTRPEILFAVHQCAWFSIDPRLSHEIAVKRIARYLKRTPNDGLVLKPDFSLGIQCCVDADFAGAWDKEDCTDPSSVYSRTGYVSMYAGCPIL